MSWNEEYQRKRRQRLVREARGELARIDSATPVEAARAKLANTALHIALSDRSISASELASRLDALVRDQPDFKQAAATLQADLLRGDLQRIAREAIAKAPSAQRVTRLLKGRQGPTRSRLQMARRSLGRA